MVESILFIYNILYVRSFFVPLNHDLDRRVHVNHRSKRIYAIHFK
jgi:hypothetical protein